MIERLSHVLDLTLCDQQYSQTFEPQAIPQIQGYERHFHEIEQGEVINDK